jgi:parvulin-like peptidyl-prolyl isomerase
MNFMWKAALTRVQLNKILFTLFCAFFILTICGCQKNGTSKPIATVDDMTISLSEFKEYFIKELDVSTDRSTLTPEDMDRLKEEVLNIIINEKVMHLRARELSLSVSDEELIKRIEEVKESYSDDGFERILVAQKVNYSVWKKELRKRMILEKLIASEVNANVSVKEHEAKAFYRTHRKMYAPGKRVHAAQIVVREKENAEMILNRLKSGEDFGKVAKEESIGPEAAKGGDLGFVSQGIMPEEIDAALFSQQTDEISPVIKSPYGYHIFKIIEIDKGTGKKWTDVKEIVLTDFKKHKQEQAYVLWLEALKSKAAIIIDRDLLKNITVPNNPGIE